MVTADTITDEQIRQVWHDYPNEITARQLMCALNEKLLLQPGWTKQEIRDARARCAEILNTRKDLPEVGRYYQVTGRRGHAKRYLGATGLCTDAYTDEGRGNLSTCYWSRRITLRTASGGIIAGLPLSQLTEVSKEAALAE